jgi:hypothetical protein
VFRNKLDNSPGQKCVTFQGQLNAVPTDPDITVTRNYFIPRSYVQQSLLFITIVPFIVYSSIRLVCPLCSWWQRQWSGCSKSRTVYSWQTRFINHSLAAMTAFGNMKLRTLQKQSHWGIPTCNERALNTHQEITTLERHNICNLKTVGK